MLPPSTGEKFLDPDNGFKEPVHLRRGVVKIETGAGGGFHAELVHEGLGAVMAAAQGHAGLIGQRHDVVRMHVLQEETHQAGAVFPGAENADIIQCGQFFDRVAGQFLVVTPDVVAADGVQVIHGGMQADGAGNIGRAGFKPVGGGFEFRLVIADGQDHLAPALIGRHAIEHFLASVKGADAGGAANLVAGEGEEIAADGLHIHGQVAGALGTIHEGYNAAFPRAGAELGDGIHGAHGVGDVHHGKDLHLGGLRRR